MTDPNCITPEAKQLVYQIAIATVLLIERWMGKTDKVESGSILELIQRLILPKTIEKSKEDKDG